MRKTSFLLVLAALLGMAVTTRAQNDFRVFEDVELMVPEGDSAAERSARVRFEDDLVTIETRSGQLLKKFTYDELRSIEYSYTNNPRWKSGVGFAAASALVPPLLLVALPMGFSKHRRHWITIVGKDDFAVLKISKSIRKVFIPAFEVRSGINIAGMRDSK